MVESRKFFSQEKNVSVDVKTTCLTSDHTSRDHFYEQRESEPYRSLGEIPLGSSASGYLRLSCNCKATHTLLLYKNPTAIYHKFKSLNA